MITLTRAQRRALKAVYDRGPLILDPETRMLHTPKLLEGYYLGRHPLSYREFRTHVKPLFAGQGCVLIPWQGMWLGIEPDGYTHS